MVRRAAALFLLIACAAAARPEETPRGGAAAGDPERGPDRPGGPFVWRSTYRAALDAALKARRPLLVYLPPGDGGDGPQAVETLPARLAAPALLEGVRASADEVLELMERFRVKKLPAVVLLDRRERVVAGWEGGIPADLPQRLVAAVRKIAEREEKDLKLFREVRKIAETGNFEGAYQKAVPLLEGEATVPEVLAALRRLEARLLETLLDRALVILAGEGLRPEADLVRELESLRGTTSHAGFRRSVDREIARLRGTRTPG